MDLPLAVLGGTLTKFTETFGSNKFSLIGASQALALTVLLENPENTR